MSDDDKKKPDQLLHLRIISKKELLKLVPYSDQHILRMEKAGTFPNRLDLSDNRVGWRYLDIVAWMNSRKVRSYPTNEGNPAAT